VTELGRVDAPAATELSGLARGRDGTFWTHNDSGDAPRVLALDRRGRLVREVVVPGAQAEDWEDIAIRGRTLYAGDIGDNRRQRPDVAVYRFTPGGPAARLALRYADGPHDAEALLVDPRGGALFVVTKDLDGRAGVYQAHRGRLRRRATLELGLGQPITAGDVSADGRIVALRSYDRAYVFTRARGESLADALRSAPCVAGADLLPEGQGEALALGRDGRAFYTVAEGPRPLLRRYAPVR
jgi:hypothetical protein